MILEYYPDHTDETGKFGMVDIKAVKALPKSVTLDAIKASQPSRTRSRQQLAPLGAAGHGRRMGDHLPDGRIVGYSVSMALSKRGDPMMNVNFSAIAAAAVVELARGGCLVHGAQSALASRLRTRPRRNDGSLGKPSPAPFIISFLAELVMALVLAVFVAGLGPVTVVSGVATAFLAWIGFVATSMVVNHRFGGAHPMLTVIDSGHWLAVLVAQGAVIGLFGS